MRLNLIGNGFDLYHGLPSSYYYFGCFLASEYPDFYCELANMYGFKCQKHTGYDDFEIVVSDLFWKDFEEKLGYLNDTWMDYRLCDDLGLECDDPIDIDPPEAANANVIKDKFCEWVCTTLNTRSNFEVVKSYLSKSKCKFPNGDFFINYNYTQTLEEVYKIPRSQILHIHGECDLDSCWGDLVVGHGNDEGIQYLKDNILKIDKKGDWLGYQSARNRLNEEKCKLEILQNLKKDVPSLCSSLIRFLHSMNEKIEEIKIWGLSCGPVDEMYIEALHTNYPDAHWSFSYFNAAEKEARITFTNKLGLKDVHLFEFTNPASLDIMKEIVKLNHITEFQKI